MDIEQEVEKESSDLKDRQQDQVQTEGVKINLPPDSELPLSNDKDQEPQELSMQSLQLGQCPLSMNQYLSVQQVEQLEQISLEERKQEKPILLHQEHQQEAIINQQQQNQQEQEQLQEFQQQEQDLQQQQEQQQQQQQQGEYFDQSLFIQQQVDQQQQGQIQTVQQQQESLIEVSQIIADQEPQPVESQIIFIKNVEQTEQMQLEQEQVVEEKVNINLLPHKQEAPIQVNSELPVQNQNQDKQEPMKNEMPSGYTQRAEQLRIDMAKRMSDAAEELHNTNKWNSINPQFSTTKCLPFNQTHKSYDFWKSNVANDIQDMFKALMPRKIVIGIMNHLNRKMKSIFPDQDDRQLKKKMYKIEQVYEYFAIKILMGYNRMPDPEDYFNEKLGFRNKICELIKEGRFKFFEAQTQFSDEILYHFKLKIENKEPKHKINGEILTYVVKKMNKVFRQACDAGQSLALIRNTFFDAQEMDKEIYCLMLFDVRTLFILQIGFAYAENTNNCIFRLLDNYKNRNHRLYLQKGLLTLDEINQLALQFSIYGSGILNKTDRDDKIVFTGDLITNGMMLLLRLRMPDGGQSILASTADGFHRNTTNDKRSYATVQLQEVIKKVEQYMYQSDQYRCLFSSATLHGALFTEVQEIVIWNSFIAFKEIQKIDQNIEFLTFRLNLTKQLLAGKIKNLPVSSLTMQQLNPKISTVGINTDITGNFGMQNKERLPYQNFHIPTKLIPPSKLQGTLVCLVCRKNTNDFTECKSCGEISGKLISLCASECFSQFHIDPKKFITGAEDIPVLQTGTQFEQSTLWQSANYQKSYEKKKADQLPK